MSFSGRFDLRPIHTITCDTAAVREKYIFECQPVLFSTFPQYSETPKILLNYIYTMHIFCYMVYERLGVILVAGRRCVPFFLYVVLPGVIYRYQSLQYTNVLPTENAVNVWLSIALLTYEVYHRVQTD